MLEKETTPQTTKNENNQDDNYITDSDIDDPKYTPVNVLYKKEPSSNVTSNLNKTPSQSNIASILQDKMKNIQKEKENQTKILQDTEIEKQKLYSELSSLNERLKSKENLISEFQTLVHSSKEKFIKLDQENNKYKKENELLIEKLSQCELKIKNQNEILAQNEEIKKNILLYKQQLKDLENTFTEKEKKLTQKYKEKEKDLKNEYEEDITRIKRDKESLQQENERLKYDIVTFKTKINSLTKEQEDKQFEHSLEVSKLKKDNKKLTDQLNEAKNEANEYELQLNSYKNKMNTTINELENKNNDLNNQLYERDEFIKELTNNLNELTQNINSLSQEGEQHKINIENKEQTINELNKKINEYEETIQSKDNDIVSLEQTNQNMYQNYCDHLNQIANEKDQVIKENEELKNNLEMMNSQYKKLQDTFQLKIQNLNNAYLNESSKIKNKENQYNELIKQMKIKEKKILNENKSLKNIIKTKDKEKMDLEHELRNQELYIQANTSYFNRPSDISYNGGYLNSTYDKIIMNKAGISRNNTMNANISNHTFMENNERDEEQKKSLDEFKKLLSKMDEKLDSSKLYSNKYVKTEE